MSKKPEENLQNNSESIKKVEKKKLFNCIDCKSCLKIDEIDEKEFCRHFAERIPGGIKYIETEKLRIKNGKCGPDARFFSFKERIKNDNNISIG